MTVDYRIVAWGDSLTYGNQDLTGTTYETVLQSVIGRPVTNKGVGGQTSTQVKTRFDAESDKWNWTTIIWVGRNNNDFTALNNDVAAMVASLGHDKFIIPSIVNFCARNSTGGENTVSNTAAYNAIITQNNTFASTYPNNYFDVRQLLIDNYDPLLPDDVYNHDVDGPPQSLMYDDRHPNQYGYTIIGNALADIIRPWNIKYGTWRLR